MLIYFIPLKDKSEGEAPRWGAMTAGKENNSSFPQIPINS
jgi:hypothetical protein